LTTSDTIRFGEAGDAEMLRKMGLDAQGVFTDSRIRVWRTLPDRENAVFEFEGVKWHIKRYWKGGHNAEKEANGIELLKQSGIPTVPLAAWGVLGDGRGFVISRDLEGFAAGDRLIKEGGDVQRILETTAAIAGKLHGASLHHRDLYLCHFFLKMSEGNARCALIDPARVRRLPWLFKRRWIVKDLAQFGYSLETAGLAGDVFEKWLGRYEKSGGWAVGGLRKAINRKIGWIARHDAALKKSQPTRNVSIE
jgi:hypothetical protein